MEYSMIKDHKFLTAVFEWDDSTSYNFEIGDFYGSVTFYNDRVLMSFTHKTRTYQGVSCVICHSGYSNAELFGTSFALAILNIKSKHKAMNNVFKTFEHSGSKLSELYSVDNVYKKGVRNYDR